MRFWGLISPLHAPARLRSKQNQIGGSQTREISSNEKAEGGPTAETKLIIEVESGKAKFGKDSARPDHRRL